VTQNTTLTFKLTVTDPGKLSATDSVDVVVKPLVQPPPAPTNVKAIAGSGQVALMWDSVAAATGYDVCIAKQSIGEVANCTTYTGGTWLIDKTSPMTITGFFILFRLFPALLRGIGCFRWNVNPLCYWF
jgi:hypothetical protein